MSNLKPVKPQDAQGHLKETYQKLEKQMGKVINIFQVMANSEQTLDGFLALSDAASKVSLSPKIREEIALVVGQCNMCEYCLSAHSTVGQMIGLKSNEILDARRGESSDPKTKAILHFVKQAVEKRAKVSDQDVADLKKAGVSDKELTEITLLIAVNLFTNYFNLIAGTEVDFPKAPKLENAMSTR